MSQEIGFVEVVVIATGEKQLVPPHYMEDPVLKLPFKWAPSARAKQAEGDDAPPEDPTDPAGDPPAEDPTPATATTTKASGKNR